MAKQVKSAFFCKNCGAESSKWVGKNITQEQFAAKLQLMGCDITRSAVAKIEVGQRHIYIDELKLIKDILETTYDELIV